MALLLFRAGSVFIALFLGPFRAKFTIFIARANIGDAPGFLDARLGILSTAPRDFVSILLHAARYVAKNIVAAGLAKRCEIQVSYAIGVAEPTSISVDTFGTGEISDARIGELVREHFDLRPYGIAKMLDLVRPIYKATAAYGHFGRELPEFTWEKTDKAEVLRKAAG